MSKMNLDIDLLHSFLAIVDTGNFTRAADCVGRTQSAVSMQMKRLEETLSKPLFMRDGRQMQLSVDGENLVGYARRMITLNDCVLAQFSQPELSGRVSLGIPDDNVARFLPSVLAAFTSQHLQVELEVRTEPSVVLDASLASGELDLALLSCAAVPDHGEIIHREPMVWVTLAHHVFEEQTLLPLATTEPYCQMRRNALMALDACDIAYLIAYIGRSYLSLQSFVLAGLAVSHSVESAVVPGMKVLDSAVGFPPIAPVHVGLRRRGGTGNLAADWLAKALTDSLKSAALLDA